MRRTWLRGRENVHKRYLIHVAGHNLGLEAVWTDLTRMKPRARATTEP
jgi:hypothetical protein